MKHSREELSKLTVDELIDKCSEQDAYIESLLSKIANRSDEVGQSQVAEDKLKQQQQEAARRENVLYMKLTTKEQELQECVKQIQELQQAQTPTSERLRTMLLDPAISLLFRRMKKEIESFREKLEQAQNDLAACKFTPDSQTGKRLMAKCRMLLQENEELGKVISTGRTARLEGEIALQKKLTQEMKKTQTDTEDFLSELDEEVEGMQSAIYLLQQQLREAHEQATQLQTDNEQLKVVVDNLTTKLSSYRVPNDLPDSGDVSMEVDSTADQTKSGETLTEIKPLSQHAAKDNHCNLSHNSVHRTSLCNASADEVDSNGTQHSEATPVDCTTKGHRSDDQHVQKTYIERNGTAHAKAQETLLECSSVKREVEIDIAIAYERTKEGIRSECQIKDEDELRTKDTANFDCSSLKSDVINAHRKPAYNHQKCETLISRDSDEVISHSTNDLQPQLLTPKSEKKHRNSKDSGEKKHRTKEDLADNGNDHANDRTKHKADIDDTEDQLRGHGTKRNKRDRDSSEREHKQKRSKGEDVPYGISGHGNGNSD